MVDGDHAGLNRRGNLLRGACRAGPGVSRQAKGQAVGLAHRVVKSGEGVDECQRAKGLFGHGTRRHGQLGNHRRRPKVARAAHGHAAGVDVRVLLACIGHQVFHGGLAPRVGQRPHGRGRFKTAAHLQLLSVHHELRDKIFVDAFLHQKTRGRYADLAGIAELARHHGLGGECHVGVVKNHHRGVAAELHGHALHVQSGHGGELLAHGRGAGERDLANSRVRDQVRRDMRRVAVDQVDHACGHARINKGTNQLGRRSRGFFGRLDDDGATGRQRC